MIVVALDPGEDWATAKFVDGRLGLARFRLVAHYGSSPDVCAVEYPVYRPGGAPATSVVRLAFNAGKIVGQIGAKKVVEVSTVSVPKFVVDRRVRQALDLVELEILDADLAGVPKGKQNNVIDAVRHGLVYLGRMPR